MRRILMILAAALAALPLTGQDLDAVLSSVERNNSTLKVLRAEADAAKAEARTGLTPSDPEIEVAYLWGSPKDQGNRIDLGLSQSFDFPTVYRYRKLIADGEATIADLEYEAGRREILEEAEKTCVTIVYHNALRAVLSRRVESARAIAEAWQKKFDKGGCSALDLNKAVLNLVDADRDFEMNEINLKAATEELVRMNGGQEIVLEDEVFTASLLPGDFESWYSDAVLNNPELRAISAGADKAANQLKLAKAEWLPKFSVGYVSERIAGTSLQGIGAGISIPLWEGKGKVKAAKARSEALEAKVEDCALQFHNTLRSKYNQASSLQRLVSGYREDVSRISSLEMLDKALFGGEISLIEYKLEQSLWYDALSNALESERDYHLLLAELHRYVR
ncbi:MAG: TolC family protein [Candidatus Cryptobacteroides sp.]